MNCETSRRVAEIEAKEQDVSSLLNQVSHDIGIEAAEIQSFDAQIETAGCKTEYEITVRLNVTEDAQFNNLFSDLFI